MLIDYEVARERMEDYRRQAEQHRTAAAVRRQQREQEQRQDMKMVVSMIEEIVRRLSWRSHETVRG